MKRIIITILIIISLLHPFSKKPKWSPKNKEYQLELINLGDLPLEIYSLVMANGQHTEIENLSMTIDSGESVAVSLFASSCIDTLIIKSNSVPDSIRKVLFIYNRLRIL